MGDGGILPTSMCQTCMQKLRVAFDLKTKSQESDKYLKQILQSATGVDAQPTPYFPDDEQESLLEPVDEEDQTLSAESDCTESPIRGRRSGEFVCKVKGCRKQFRYVKSFNNHTRQHKQQSLTKSGSIRKYPLKKKVIQPPYDSQSPYGSPAPYKAPPSRDSSPDFSTTLMSFMNSEEPLAKRSRKQKLPSRTPSPEPMPTVTLSYPGVRGRPRKLAPVRAAREREKSPTPSEDHLSLQQNEDSSPPRKGRGRQRKSQAQSESSYDGNGDASHDSNYTDKRSRGKPRTTPKLTEVIVNDDSDEANGEALEGFKVDWKEVDVNQVLKANSFSIMADDSVSQSALSTARSRSRSSSVELIPDYDIFGTVIPDSSKAIVKPIAQSSGAGSRSTFKCDHKGCSSKFHLKANLMKHKREEH